MVLNMQKIKKFLKYKKAMNFGKVWGGWDVRKRVPTVGLILLLILGLAFSLFSFPLPVKEAEANGTTYYVDNTITDTNVGSATPDFTTYNPTTFETTGGSASVYKTIADINTFSALAAGDSVLFRKGQTWWETLIVPSSGSAGSPITFGAFGTEDDPIINSVWAYRVNNRTVAEYEVSGVGHKWDAGYSQNGSFEHYTGNNFNYWIETVSGSGTITTDTVTFYDGVASANLFDGADGAGYANLNNAIYLARNQKYDISFWAKSDGTGSGTTRFYEATNGLSNTITDGIYQTWTGYQNITAMSVANTDTTWTEKTITVLVDGSEHTSGMQNITQTANGHHWLDKVTVRPRWVNYGGNIWSIGYESAQTGVILKAAFDGVPTLPAADQDSVNSTNKWYNRTINSHVHILYVYSTENPETSSINIDLVTTFSSRSVDLNDKNYITIQDLRLQNADTIVDNAGTNGIVDNCILNNSFYSVNIDANNFTLSNSTLSYSDWSVRVTTSADTLISGNTINHNFKLGIVNEGGGIAASVVTGNITGLVVQDNIIHDSEAYGIAEYGTNASNKISGAIYRRNEIYDVLYGFFSQSLSNGLSGNVVSYNIIHTPKSGSSIGLFCYRPGNNTAFYNNIIDSFASGIDLYNSANLYTFKNNIIYNSVNYHINDSSNNSSGIFSHNTYYPDGATKFHYHSTDYNLAGWKTASSQDASSVNSDPLFVSASDFHLQPTSPAINAGVDVGLTSDYEGSSVPECRNTGYDIGAYEYQSTCHYGGGPGFIPLPSPPLPVTDVTVSPGNGQVSLSWTNSNDASTQVLVYHQRGYPITYRDYQNQIYSGSNSSYTDINLTNKETYYYSIYNYRFLWSAFFGC